MKTIKVKLKKRSYNILIGSHILKNIGKVIKNLQIGTDAYIITTALIKNKYGNLLSCGLLSQGISCRFKLIPDSEKSKSLKIAYELIKDISEYEKNKKLFIVAFGGGVTGDLAGFVASIYKRGIPYLQVPTTLLAQVDSSIGGKTAVDLSRGKNLVGAFYQPKMVFSDVALLQSLSPRQVKTGLAEVIKYAIIKDPKLFSYLEQNYLAILKAKENALEFIVNRSSKIKAAIVSTDEKEEKGLRTTLNFGHTMGHAIETAGGYKKYNHGEAIALGMLIAAQIGVKLGVTEQKISEEIEDLLRRVGLPLKIKNISAKKIIQAHYLDKKFSGKQNKFVLIKKIGKTQILKDIPLKTIQEALKKSF